MGHFVDIGGVFKMLGILAPVLAVLLLIAFLWQGPGPFVAVGIFIGGIAVLLWQMLKKRGNPHEGKFDKKE